MLEKIIIDEMHEQIYGRVTEEPETYNLSVCTGFIVISAEYEFISPWNDGAQPNAIQIIRGENIYQRAFSVATTETTIQGDLVEVIDGEKFQSFIEGDSAVLAIGVSTGESFRPFWVGNIEITNQ